MRTLISALSLHKPASRLLGAAALNVRRSLPEIVLAGVAAVMILLEVWALDPGGWATGRTLAGLGAALSLAFLRRAPFAAYLANGVSIYALIAPGSPASSTSGPTSWPSSSSPAGSPWARL